MPKSHELAHYYFNAVWKQTFQSGTAELVLSQEKHSFDLGIKWESVVCSNDVLHRTKEIKHCFSLLRYHLNLVKLLKLLFYEYFSC